nr:hypothetical protein [Rhodococcus sp. 114MFTsu3.1]
MSYSTAQPQRDFSGSVRTDSAISAGADGSLEFCTEDAGHSGDRSWSSSELRELGKAIAGAHRGR